MKEKKPMDLLQAEKVFRGIFFCGFLCAILGLMLENTATYVLGTAGIVGILGGLCFGFLKIRCPECGKSLTQGRMPGVPAFCPYCGRQLKNREA